MKKYMRFNYLTRTVIILSFISLFTDIGSELLYPVIPIYLASLNYSAFYIGIIEGIAEFIAGLSKGYFGVWSDNINKRLPFVRTGYILSSVSKPLMGLIANAYWILFTRTLDRFGKGIRTAARDAMLSAESKQTDKGKVFGFHRAMDTLGAAIGPALALLFLWLFPGQYTTLFVITIIPGLITIALLWRLKENSNYQNKEHKKTSFFSFITYIKNSSKKYKILISGLLIFYLFNSSDMFLLFKLKEMQFNDTFTIGMYILYNLSYAIFSFPAGILADKIGLNKVYLLGLLIFSAVYVGMAFTNSSTIIVLLFLLYGFYSAATEGISKAWISNIVPASETASAIGSFNSLQSVALLMASLIAGFIWVTFGSQVTFIVTAASAILSVIFLIVFFK